MPPLFAHHSKWDTGLKFIDDPLCDECGICEKLCPYGALKMDPEAVFDMDKCYGCWTCYNHCPHKVIYTKKFREVRHYPKPIDSLKNKIASR